ncbi:MAG: hypothetical protein J6M62_02480 [Selenomonadaceae bacterium]|nr:hypothetical protein [Selenomonadaceae bacterium]MBP3723792.1 hypothetical protein [Selenomonadaceae bacterium]
MNYAKKMKNLKKLLAKKEAEKERIKDDFRAKKILSREAAKLLAGVNDEISRIMKEIKKISK